MSEFKGTNGKWESHYNGTYFEIREAGSYRQIGDACASTHVYDNSIENGPMAKANSELMSAAPELLEALRAMMNRFVSIAEDAGIWEPEEDKAYIYAENVIKKALGVK